MGISTPHLKNLPKILKRQPQYRIAPRLPHQPRHQPRIQTVISDQTFQIHFFIRYHPLRRYHIQRLRYHYRNQTG